jgi:hypothetical protein
LLANACKRRREIVALGGRLSCAVPKCLVFIIFTEAADHPLTEPRLDGTFLEPPQRFNLAENDANSAFLNGREAVDGIGGNQICLCQMSPESAGVS